MVLNIKALALAGAVVWGGGYLLIGWLYNPAAGRQKSAAAQA